MAFRLPMRNWNHEHRTKVQIWKYCFQTTYEELKQAAQDNLEAQLESFQTTYEELKQAAERDLRDRERFQTTYEELKLFEGSEPQTRMIAFRLPMRNWNGRSSPDRVWGPLAFRLPMRNWNYDLCTHLLGQPPSLSDYLWGIETDQESCSLSSWIRFQTTYEELKPECWWVIPFPYRLLSDYLWGIETIWSGQRNQTL